MKCDTCDVMRRVNKSEEPAACKWFIENVICGDKNVEDCSEYKKESKYG